MAEDSYHRRPLWHWIVLYAVVGIILYGIFYYVIISKNQPSNQSTSLAPVPTVVTTRVDPKKGSYLADINGNTLYVFDKDTTGKSNCSGTCASIWPPYLVPTTPPSSYPINVSFIKRDDNSLQYSWKGMPLYYYAKDSKPGDINGDGVGGIWHLVHP